VKRFTYFLDKMKNLLVYPLYKIKGRGSEYEGHKLNLQKNIEIVEKFGCVDAIKVIGSEVDHWSEMVGDMIEKIYELNISGNNVLFSEIDTVFLQEFSEIFSLEKLTMFARCNGASKIDPSLSAGYYLNSGLTYYPANLDSSIWELSRNKFKSDNSIAVAGTTYEVLVNRMFYSQFSDMKSGIDYIKKTVGFSKYNWRGHLIVDDDQMPEDPSEIKHVHFLNMSEYIHGNSSFAPFWYNEFLDRFHSCVISGESAANVLIDLLQYYADQNGLRAGKKPNIQKYIAKFKEKIK